MFYKKALNDFRFVMLAFVIMTSAAACSSNKDSPFDQRGIAPEGKHDVVKGPLSLAYRSVQDSLYRENCDQKLSDIQSTLIAALDLKSAEILEESIAKKDHPDSYIPFSKSYLINNPKKPARKGWQDEPYSWSLANDFYNKHVNDSTPQFWSTLDAYVRSLITDDRKRVVYGYNLSLTHDQVEKLSAMKEIAESCKTDTRCIQPHWSDDQLKIISEVPAYAYYQSALEKSHYFRDQRKYIEKLFDRIESDYNFHHDEYNGMVTQHKVDGKNTFSLPMDNSNLSDNDRSILEGAITSVWNNSANAVNISWKTAVPPMSLFHFLFELEPNNRSYVNFPLKEIHLFPYTAIRTIAHEFGHVLGFDDHYYTLWDSEKCEYRAQYNEEDIMSGSDTGDVTDEEWKMLFDQYGNR